MTGRRALSDMLIDVAGGVTDARVPPGVRVTSLQVSLPVEVAVALADGEPAVLADLPRFVFRTSFDRPPSRLTVVWADGGPA